MNREPADVRLSPASTQATGPAVWDRLWQIPHRDARDDALIERERRNPRWAAIVARLEATFGTVDGLRTIELGSGRGDLSALLAQLGAEVTLLDRSEPAMQQAKSRFDRLQLTARYELGDILSARDAWRDRFDVALSSGVIEHFKGGDRTRVVRAHYSALRAGGLAVISVPHAWSLPYRLWKLYLEVRGWWPYGMEIPYARRELAERARAAGLAGIEMHCTGFWESVGSHCVTPLVEPIPKPLWDRLSSRLGRRRNRLWDRPLGRRLDWVERTSLLDGCLGATLLMFARRAT